MKLSEAITELVELLIAGEPPSSDWASIYDNAARQLAHHERLSELRDFIDGVTP